MARLLGRSPSTVTRELSRNGGYDRYRAALADETAWARARRPKRRKLPNNQRLRQAVASKPVAWIYVTGWVARDGTVNFRDDVYKHDETLDRDALADVAAGGFVAR